MKDVTQSGSKSVVARHPHVVNVATVAHRSPFRYPGGKTWLVPHVRRWVAAQPTRPTRFVEPFAGGAIVGLSMLFDGLVDELVIAEIDEDVAAVWRTIVNGRGKALAEAIASFHPTPTSVQKVLESRPRNLFERAFATLVKNRVHRGGILAPGARPMNRGENGRGLASRWYPETLRKRILDITAMRGKITVIEGDAIQVLTNDATREGTLYFIDPPYTVASRRLYRYSRVDHAQLFKVCTTLKGAFLMCYDDTTEIVNLARQFNFSTARVPMKTTHHTVKKELLVGRCMTWLQTK